jgi:hypothetical protein
MAFTSILASQTDADSPINQTLMDLIRTNLDDLDGRISISTGQGAAKGWILFDGTGAIAILDSFNVTSIVDNGTGDYTINWDVDFANANYCAVGTASNNVGGNPAWVFLQNRAVGSIDVYLLNHATVAADYNRISVVALGDQ